MYDFFISRFLNCKCFTEAFGIKVSVGFLSRICKRKKNSHVHISYS